MKMSAFSFNSHPSEAGWHKHPDTAWDLKENPHVMACASEEVYRKALKDVAKCCCLRVIGGGNVALLMLIVASALVCQQTWIFSSPYLPWALTRCDKSGARSEGRVSYLVDTGVSYVHEFLLINVRVFTTAAHLQVNGQIRAGWWRGATY